VVAAIEVSIVRKREAKGRGVVVGPSLQLNAAFPLRSVGHLLRFVRRLQPAGQDRLLDLVALDRPLVTWTDCLILLTILLTWSRLDFWPDPEDFKHFDVISSCLW
jgi:hypothetical protein